ncbi:hypothetical protein ABTD96_20475, partial [Acinetobacter baumannii]
IPGLKILGDPHLSIVAYGSDSFDIFRVAEAMSDKGWLPGLLQKPKAIQRMMSQLHALGLADYLSDLRVAVEAVRAAGGKQATI